MNSPSADPRKIIIVEDDEDLRASIIKYLQLKGFDVVGVGRALDFYAEVSATPYSIAILDLALPDQDGLVISKYLRANTSMRIVMLTARTTLEDRLAGYESGADAYLVKPVDFRELAASLVSLFGRLDTDGAANRESSSRPQLKGWRLQKEDWVLTPPDGQSVKLTSKEFLFLNTLAEHSESIVSREVLLSELGYPVNESSNRSLESLVYRLRKKISTTLDTPIKTASGSGYTFSCDIECV